MEYICGVPYDSCGGCGKKLPAYELLYDGVEPDVHSPRCAGCIIRQAQEIYGVENVILPPATYPSLPPESRN